MGFWGNFAVVLIAVWAVFNFWLSPSDAGSHYSTASHYASTSFSKNIQAQHPGKVVFYSTAWCGYCTKTRRLLRNKGINYVELDIEKSRTAAAEHEGLGGGIPVMVIQGKVIRGYQEDAILALTKS